MMINPPPMKGARYTFNMAIRNTSLSVAIAKGFVPLIDDLGVSGSNPTLITFSWRVQNNQSLGWKAERQQNHIKFLPTLKITLIRRGPTLADGFSQPFSKVFW